MFVILHQCIIPDGLLEGNTHTVEVTPDDIEYGTHCEVCEELLVSLTTVVAALYEKTLEEEPSDDH